MWIEKIMFKFIIQLRQILMDNLYTSTFLIIGKFLLSANALSFECHERDLVNSITSFSNNSATFRLMYSLPLSE